MFFGCFSVVNYSPESMAISTHGIEHLDSGKQPDLTLMRTLLLGIVVVVSNLKLVCDSSETNLLTVTAVVVSIGSFFGVLCVTSANPNSVDFSVLSNAQLYPGYLLCVVLFCLSVWPVNYLVFLRQGRELRDER